MRREHESPFTDDVPVMGVARVVGIAAKDGSFDCHDMRDHDDSSCFAALLCAPAERH